MGPVKTNESCDVCVLYRALTLRFFVGSAEKHDEIRCGGMENENPAIRNHPIGILFFGVSAGFCETQRGAHPRFRGIWYILYV